MQLSWSLLSDFLYHLIEDLNFIFVLYGSSMKLKIDNNEYMFDTSSGFDNSLPRQFGSLQQLRAFLAR